MRRLLSYLAVFLLGFLACAYIIHRLPPYQGLPAAAVTALAGYVPPAAAPVSRPPITERFTVADAIAHVEPAVVNIDTMGRAMARETPGSVEDRWLRRFFGTPRLRREAAPRGVASGVIISPDGFVLTNHHVIEDADRIRVTLPDKRRFDGIVVGSDPDSDLAIVKINGRGLPTARLGDSRRLRKGEWVVAIGNPLGFESTATVGVVSATRRGSFTVEGKRLHNVIQTDAAINQGNSGGALVNLDGELVGINTAIVSTPLSGGSIGIGFAIPINDARPVVAELVRYGKVLRPWIGISYEPTGDPHDAWSDTKPSVVVRRVFRDSPAATAGLHAGDILRRLDRTAVSTMDDVIEFVARHSPGDAVPVVVSRQGHHKQLKLRLGRKPEPSQLNSLAQQP